MKIENQELNLQEEYLLTVRQLIRSCSIPSEIEINCITSKHTPIATHLDQLVDDICDNAAKIIERSMTYVMQETQEPDEFLIGEYGESKKMSIELSEKMPKFFTLALLKTKMKKDKMKNIKKSVEDMIKWGVLCGYPNGEFYFPWGKFFEGALEEDYLEEQPF